MHNAQCTIKVSAFGGQMPIRACKGAAAKGFGGDRKAPEIGRAACFDPALAMGVKQAEKTCGTNTNLVYL